MKRGGVRQFEVSKKTVIHFLLHGEQNQFISFLYKLMIEKLGNVLKLLVLVWKIQLNWLMNECMNGGKCEIEIMWNACPFLIQRSFFVLDFPCVTKRCVRNYKNSTFFLMLRCLSQYCENERKYLFPNW